MTRARRGAALLLALCILLLSGCRDSPTLVEYLYNQQATEVTDIDSLVDNDPDHTEEEDMFSVDERDEADTERDREQDTPLEGENDDQVQSQAATVLVDPDISSDLPTDTAPATEAGTDTGERESAVQAGSGGGDGGTDNASGGGGGDGDNQIPDDDGGTALEAPKARRYREIVTEDGDLITVPEDVDTVSAVGEAALIVQMLGGSGRLVATSADFAENDLAQRAFSGEGLGDAAVLWSGDGSGNISEAGLAELIALDPDVCFVVSGQNTFSESQLATLVEQGITPVTLPSLNSHTGIQKAVTLVGQVLGDRRDEGGTDAPALASEYQTWTTNLLSTVESRGPGRFAPNNIDYDNDGTGGYRTLTGSNQPENGQYTLFVSGWDTGATYRLYDSGGGGYVYDQAGVPFTTMGYTDSPLSYYMSVAGVANRGAVMASYSTEAYNWYINPISSVAHPFVIDGSYRYYTGINDTRLTGSPSWTEDNLGGGNFRAIVVASREIKTQLENNLLWQNHGWNLSQGNTSGYGFLDNSGQLVYSTIVGDYDIYVNPQGLGSWTSGSVESPLEAAWISNQFFGGITDSELESYIRDFYSTFYRYSLSDSELQSILNGQ